MTITGNGSNNGPTPGNLYGETEQAALDEINQKMRDNGGYSVDAEGILDSNNSKPISLFCFKQSQLIFRKN